MEEPKHFTAPRLGEFSYHGSFAYFITICTFKKNPYFKDPKTVEPLLEILEDSVHKNGFVLYAYCFMPDHLHLLLLGSEDSSLEALMRQFKQKSGFCFKRVFGQTLWQRSYYDHVLRKEESLNEVALYILNNPVRKGLVNDLRDYSCLGSSVFDVRNMK
jgi:putative transposase